MGEDYSAIDATVDFPPGTEAGGANAQQCFMVSTGGSNTEVIDDQVVERSESVTLEASSTNQDVQFTEAGGNRASLQIVDDDGESIFKCIELPHHVFSIWQLLMSLLLSYQHQILMSMWVTFRAVCH